MIYFKLTLIYILFNMLLFLVGRVIALLLAIGHLEPLCYSDSLYYCSSTLSGCEDEKILKVFYIPNKIWGPDLQEPEPSHLNISYHVPNEKKRLREEEPGRSFKVNQKVTDLVYKNVCIREP